MVRWAVGDKHSPTHSQLLHMNTSGLFGFCLGSIQWQDSLVGVVSEEIESNWDRGVCRRDWTTIVPKTSPTARLMFSRLLISFNQLVGRALSDSNTTINGGLVFGSESGLKWRYVRFASTGFACSSPTDPRLLQGGLSGLFGVLLGECSVKGFACGSCFDGDRVESVRCRDRNVTFAKPSRPLARCSLDLFRLVISWILEG